MTLERNRIALDLDGTVMQWERGYSEWLIRTGRYTREQLPLSETWDFGNWPQSAQDNFKDDYKGFIRDGGLLDLEPIEGAVEGTQRLTELGFVIHVTTHRMFYDAEVNHRAAMDTLRSLYSWNIPHSGITFDGDKDLHHADILIDDAERNLKPWIALGRKAIGFRQLYNQNMGTSPHLYWAENWSEIVTYCEEIRERGYAYRVRY